MFGWRDETDRITFIKSLNDLLSVKNLIVERLNVRIQQTPIQKKYELQKKLREQDKQRARLINLISYYGGKPTWSKVNLLQIDASTPATIANAIFKKNNDKLDNFKSEFSTSNYCEDQKNSGMCKEIEIQSAKEDIIIRNEEILQTKSLLKTAKKIKAEDAIKILKHNVEEKESLSGTSKKTIMRTLSEIDFKHADHDAFTLGSAIGDILTSYWNSKENPSKVYVFNRRIHHGGIGALLSLSSLYKKQPQVTGILSGLGERLANDDYNDSKEWFRFRKKEDDK